ncbi:Amidohydrolase 3 [Phaffia rhodozyma]|uniref:Amidohydrolase 3 n=1 Tax=Phaffia rhodozyma TaxID=264483 RepID=A0A0F7SKL8_PHARH|nr:Amidohydrolase 3 [Phaffia rhodozyma]
MQAATQRRRAQKLASASDRLLRPTSTNTPPPPPSSLRSGPLRSARLRLISSAFVIVVVVLASRLKSSTSKIERYDLGIGQGEWVVGRFDESYALCGGKGIWTGVEEENEECMVVDKKMVVDVGTYDHVRRHWGDQESLGPPLSPSSQAPLSVRKQGIKVYKLPKGLVDSHGHITEYGYWKSAVDLIGATSIHDVVHRLREALSKDSTKSSDDPTRWIEGMGWNQNLWKEATFPNASDLDADDALKGRFIVLKRIDAHGVWVSKAVLDLMSPLPDDVEGGEIIRDSFGNPTGIFLDNAMKLVDNIRPPRTEHETISYIRRTILDGLRLGLVGIHDAGTPLAEVETYKKLAASNNLPLRVYSMLTCPDRSKYCGKGQKRVDWKEYDGRFVLRSVKLVSDGALGSWGAAMHEPYSDRTDGWRGIMLQPEESFKPLVAEWVNAGWQVNIHAIGDRANTAVIDAFENVLENQTIRGENAFRLRIEHSQILTERDVKRVVDLGVIASYQTTHATSDMAYAEEKIGLERMKGAYAWQTILSSGGRISSDFPIESLDPLKGFYSGVTRLNETGDSPHGKDGWFPKEKLTRAQAMKGMTIDANYASFSENISGTLRPGFRADYVIWSDDLMSVEPGFIKNLKPLVTIQPSFFFSLLTYATPLSASSWMMQETD